MKILHTSDWHIGCTLYRKPRYDESAAFLDWLSETIQRSEIDVLLVAGDVFHTKAPTHRAQELYYRFLCRVAESPCRHVVIAAGNHDSPTFLDAPKDVLKAIDVHVVGSASENLEDEVLVLCDRRKVPELIVCAVPYLGDNDVRKAEAGESSDDKKWKQQEGVRQHYASIATFAEQKRDSLQINIPIVAMGHLFAAGGQTVDGDGVNENRLVGNLGYITANVFLPCFDYVALGHLHVPQKVSGSETRRYSGSPLPIGFGEAEQQKSVCQVTFTQSQNRCETLVQLISVPTFQKLQRISGDWVTISNCLRSLVKEDSRAWLEVNYEGDEIISDLRDRIENEIEGTRLELLSAISRNTRCDRAMTQTHVDETLKELDEYKVFERYLNEHEVPEEQREELRHAYSEIVKSLNEEDSNAE